MSVQAVNQLPHDGADAAGLVIFAENFRSDFCGRTIRVCLKLLGSATDAGRDLVELFRDTLSVICSLLTGKLRIRHGRCLQVRLFRVCDKVSRRLAGYGFS